MKTSEYRSHDNATVLRNAMPFDLDFHLLDAWVWNSRSEARVRARSIVMNSPQFEDPSEMVLVERNHEIQTLSPCATNQAFTKCIGLRRPTGFSILSNLT